MKVRYVKQKIGCIEVFTIGKVYEGVIELGELIVIDDYGYHSIMYRTEYEVIEE